MEYSSFKLHELEDELSSAYTRLKREEKTIKELKAAIERMKAKEIQNFGSGRATPP